MTILVHCPALTNRITRHIASSCSKPNYEQKQPPTRKPRVFLMVDLNLWKCKACGASAVTPGNAARIDAAVEESIRAQASQFLDVIKSKSGLSFDEIGARLGTAPSYLSSLRTMKKTPSFHLWNVLKLLAIEPKVMIERLDPDYDISGENLLLRA